MLLEAYHRLGGDTIKTEASVVVVRDKHSNPLIVACELSPGAYEFSKLGDPDFESVCKALGIPQTVIIRTVAPPPPQRGDRQLLGPGGIHGA